MSLDPTWTTVHLARRALERGHRVRFVEPWDFEVTARGWLTARAHAFDPGPTSAEAIVDALHGRHAPRKYVRVDSMDVLLVRHAPLDTALLAFASIAKGHGVQVINDPGGMVQASHKAWLAGLRDVPKPATLVTQSPGAAHLFYEKRRAPVIVKPARGSGGHGVHLVKRRDPTGFEQAFAQARGRATHVVVQEYLEEHAKEGEKRLVWMDGELLGGYLRTRAAGEFRHNLKQGGTPVATTITEAERETIAALSPHLLGIGIRFAGIDLIGPYVIEVNTLNPGGAYHADRLHDTDMAGRIIEALERTVDPHTPRRDAWARPVP